MSKKRILISPNSFKECADSVTIARLIKSNLDKLENTELILKPISDGGDGFLNVCQFYFGGDLRFYPITTAFDESVFSCPVLYCESRKELYIESAEVLGLKIVVNEFRQPLKLSSKGLGELLVKLEEDVQNNKIKLERVYLGIGGTATIDMGIGMMSKLGLKLFDPSDRELTVIPNNFSEAKKIAYNPAPFSFEIFPIVDVRNSLLGSEGGVQMFGAQKGATNQESSFIEKGFSNLLKLFENKGLEISSDKLSGAGGGIPAALQIFYKSPIMYSTDFIRFKLYFENLSNNVDYLITGEGAYDYQSNYGKGAGILLELFSTKKTEIFLISGLISEKSQEALPENVVPIELSKYFNSVSESIEKYEEGIHKACEEIVNQLKF